MKSHAIEKNYEKFWSRNDSRFVYPTEFVVRIFLANYPKLRYKKPNNGDRVLDMAFGDARNTVFLCQQGYQVSGVEISSEIVLKARARLKNYGLSADLRVGRNSNIPFESNYFNYVLACHCCYYCDEGDSFDTNISEYARVITPGGWLIASVADCSSYIFEGAVKRGDGTREIKVDPYGNRNGYRLFCVSSTEEISLSLSKHFCNIQIGRSVNNYFGIDERLYWVVAQKK